MAGIYKLLCFTIIAITFNSVIAVDYCNIKSCEKDSHTMCIHPSPTPAAKCKQWSNAGLNNAEKQAIINKHNELRRKVALGQEKRGNPGPQPGAVNMPNLSWDNELEMIAQRWANQCNFNHDKCRNVERFVVGQNIAWRSYTGTKNPFTLQSVVQSWYDEVTKFNKNGVSSYTFDPNTGHYTQVVWARTTKIGCGRINYKDSNGWNSQLVVCNYGPSGNWIGQRIY